MGGGGGGWGGPDSFQLFLGMKGEVVPGRKGKWGGLTRCGGHQDMLVVGAWCQRAVRTGCIDSLTLWTGSGAEAWGVGQGGGRSSAGATNLICGGSGAGSGRGGRRAREHWFNCLKTTGLMMEQERVGAGEAWPRRRPRGGEMGGSAWGEIGGNQKAVCEQRAPD